MVPYFWSIILKTQIIQKSTFNLIQCLVLIFTIEIIPVLFCFALFWVSYCLFNQFPHRCYRLITATLETIKTLKNSENLLSIPQ